MKISLSIILISNLYLLQDGQEILWKSCYIINCIISPWWKYIYQLWMKE